MDRIEVRIIDAYKGVTPRFLAKLTQRGHLISNMDDLMRLYEENKDALMSEYFAETPHTTLRRMNYIVVAITGLSTKAVSQLRTHATRLTFVSTSTQYSSYEGRADNYVYPPNITDEEHKAMEDAYAKINGAYSRLIESGMDKDKAGYLLPQGLRKAIIVAGNLSDWQYVMRTRLCRRNTEEVQAIMQQLLDEIEREFGAEVAISCAPSCYKGSCQEGKFCCGKKWERW